MFFRLKHALRSSRKVAARVVRRDRRLTPEVAALETRSLLSTIPSFKNGANLFVTELYNDLFRRNPTAGELSYNATYIQNGGSVEALTHKLVTSTERKAVETVFFYQNYLNRNPDLGGLVYQIDQLNHGASPIQVQVGLITSPEFQSAHVSNKSYVDALYFDILGRAPDGPGEFSYVSRLNTNAATRKDVALSLFNSQEYASRVINADFNLVLNRGAEASAANYWTPNFRATGKDADLLVALFASPENFNNLKKLS